VKIRRDDKMQTESMVISKEDIQKLPEGRKAKSTAEHRTERIDRLRNLILNTMPEISSERVRYYTEAYTKHEAEPVVMKRARALDTMLEKMSIYILDGELLVGNTCRYPRGVELFPEFEVEWIERELKDDPYPFDKRPGDRFIIKDEARAELEELLPRWHGKTHCERVFSLLPDTTKKAWDMMVTNSYWLMQGGDGHITIDFKMILKKGLKGIIEEIEEKLSELSFADPDIVRKKNFYEATMLSLKAAVKYAKRYSDYALKMVDKESDEKRKEELRAIASICARVPYNPAESFYEALQSIWFVQVILQIENNGHSMSLGRLDQTLFPYFLNDYNNGILSIEEAAELLQNFWLKLFTVNKIRDWDSTRFFAGYQVYQNITLAGQLYGGVDATNLLSYMFLGVQKAIRLIAPSLSFRFFDGISEEFLQEVIDIVLLGGGQPALYSDETVIPALMNRGIDYGDAVNWSVVGCVEPIIEGKEGFRPNGASFISMLKILELTLHGGKDPKSGLTLKKLEGDLSSFSSFEEVMENWQTQARFYIEQQVALDNIIDTSMEELIPNPFVSCFVHDCIGRAKTIKQGGALYDFCGPLIVGLANVGDSLAAIKKIVFEEKKITGGQLLHALDTNFEDNSTTPTGAEIQKMLLNSPKYGNDDDYVDQLTAGALGFFCEELPHYHVTRSGKGPRGCVWQASTSSVSGNVPFGQYIGATPDGRKDGEPTADTTSPTHGMDRKGPLSAMKSVSKIPNVLSSGGNLFNMKFSPLVLQDEAGRRKFSSLIRTYLGDLKGMHVQFNIVDSNVLREAKKQPEHYPDLMVRVAGYSALFTTLDPKLQDDIIARTDNIVL
jgi:pyruvate formate-lyase/glycerol dehydratase family glycyl radical enzyme